MIIIWGLFRQPKPLSKFVPIPRDSKLIIKLDSMPISDSMMLRIGWPVGRGLAHKSSLLDQPVAQTSKEGSSELPWLKPALPCFHSKFFTNRWSHWKKLLFRNTRFCHLSILRWLISLPWFHWDFFFLLLSIVPLSETDKKKLFKKGSISRNVVLYLVHAPSAHGNTLLADQLKGPRAMLHSRDLNPWYPLHQVSASSAGPRALRERREFNQTRSLSLKSQFLCCLTHTHLIANGGWLQRETTFFVDPWETKIWDVLWVADVVGVNNSTQQKKSKQSSGCTSNIFFLFMIVDMTST